MRSRAWSQRRTASGIAALLLAAGSGAVLWEEIKVKAGDGADRWRTKVTDELAHRHLDDAWVLAGCGVVALFGAWLLLMAVTPGLRHRHLMRTDEGLTATLDRRGAREALRDTARGVPGVVSSKVRFGRRRATVHAVIGYGDTEGVRQDLERKLAARRERLRLARPPFVTAKVSVPK